jgi:hypothetical protein
MVSGIAGRTMCAYRRRAGKSGGSRTGGLHFRRSCVSDLADRLQFLIANPTMREAAGEAAKRLVRDRYQWSKIALEIECRYFEMMGWDWTEAAASKPSASVTSPVNPSEGELRQLPQEPSSQTTERIS